MRFLALAGLTDLVHELSKHSESLLRALFANIYFALDSLKDGVAAPPLAYRLPFVIVKRLLSVAGPSIARAMILRQRKRRSLILNRLRGLQSPRILTRRWHVAIIE